MSDAHPWSKKIEDKEGASLEGSDRGWTKENSFRSEARVSAATYLDQDEKKYYNLFDLKTSAMGQQRWARSYKTLHSIAVDSWLSNLFGYKQPGDFYGISQG